MSRLPDREEQTNKDRGGYHPPILLLFGTAPRAGGFALPRGATPIFSFFAKKEKTVVDAKRERRGRDSFEMGSLSGAKLGIGPTSYRLRLPRGEM